MEDNNEGRTVSYTMEEILAMEDRTDHDRLDAMRDEDIDYTDIPDHGDDDEFWARAVKMPRTKQGIFIRLDADVLEWFKGQGPGYQTRMNAVLRSYMEHHG